MFTCYLASTNLQEMLQVCTLYLVNVVNICTLNVLSCTSILVGICDIWTNKLCAVSYLQLSLSSSPWVGPGASPKNYGILFLEMLHFCAFYALFNKALICNS